MNFPKAVLRLLLGRRLPTTSGTLKVSGIHHPVLIRRDQYGIPYLQAEDDEDAWYGLGFCQGQDRAFQLETYLRAVRGTAAEMAGPTALPVDQLSRRIGFYHAAQQQLEALDDKGRLVLQAFAQGVTQGVKVGCSKPAHEFALLRAEPTAYTAADALGVLKLMSFNLASNWDCELARLKILTQDGPDALQALDPAYPEWLPTTSTPLAPAGAALDRLAEDLASFAAAIGGGGGSNNWAIAPSRTTTDRPILANDPHLTSVLPPYWYLARVHTPDWTVAGASFVGVPTFPVGHNGVSAWGITAGLLDNTDLFIERTGLDGKSVRFDGEYVGCQVRRETINIKGADPIVEEVLVTARGPIIGPALAGEVGAISLRAVWLEPRPAVGLLQIHRARSFEEFRRCFERWPAVPLNLVYADVSGTVGWQLVGEAPRRRKGCGAIPLPGWDPEVGWEEDTVPFDQMPYLEDPDVGFVATANSKPTPADAPPFLGVDWLDGYRLARITEALESRGDWDVTSVQALQMDLVSVPWPELRDAILTVPTLDHGTRQALTLLESWSGGVASDSPAATVFEFFLAEMAQRVVWAKAPRSAEWALGKGFTLTLPHSMFATRRIGHLVRLLREQPQGWFDRSWSEEMADALATVVRTLRERYGEDTSQWAWGSVRPLTLRHSVGERAPLDRVFNLGPFPWGGDSNTVAQASVDPLNPSANPSYIASLRMVVDVGNWDESRFALPGGQSGNPFSRHYDDLLPFWLRGRGVPIAWSLEHVDAMVHKVLRLVPQ